MPSSARLTAVCDLGIKGCQQPEPAPFTHTLRMDSKVAISSSDTKRSSCVGFPYLITKSTYMPIRSAGYQQQVILTVTNTYVNQAETGTRVESQPS